MYKAITIKTKGLELEALLIREDNPRLALCQDRVSHIDDANNVLASVDLLEYFQPDTSDTIFLPFSGEFITNESFYIWENSKRETCDFKTAIATWSPEYAQGVLDIKSEPFVSRAEGANAANDKLIDKACELVLSLHQYHSELIEPEYDKSNDEPVQEY